MSGVPYTFASATSSIPLSQLDANFATPVTIGTTTVGLGNTTTTLAGLSNVSTTVTNTSNVASNGSLLLQTNGTTTAVTIDTSQNVGIGTSSPTSKLGIQATSGNNAYIECGGNGNTLGSASALFGQDSGGYAYCWNRANFPVLFGTNGTERMRIDSSGNLNVGQTSGGLQNSNSFSLGIDGNGFRVSHASGTSSGAVYCNFGYNGSSIGSITQNGTTGVLYNISSDYRLKENVQPITNAQSVIQQLNPVTFDWISDKTNDSGFIAHEFQSVLPRSVTGTKDGTKEEEYEVTPAVKDEQGNIVTPAVMGTRTVPVYQGMDNSGAVPYLVAAMKELIEEVNTLKTQVAALQAKVGV